MASSCIRCVLRMKNPIVCVSRRLTTSSLIQINRIIKYREYNAITYVPCRLASAIVDFAHAESASDDLESLRKKHREEASSEHLSDDGVSFCDLPLKPELSKRLMGLGYQKPFEIQTKTLEHTLKGCDVIARAVTGSGKTLAFSIPIVQKLMENPVGFSRGTGRPRAIVLAPTRELCNQIYRSIQELQPSVRCVALYGGDSIVRQTRELQRGVDVVCATPGRLNDHISRGNLKLDQIAFLCLDEADELLTPNFKDQIEDVLTRSPRNKQTLLFSATMPPDVRHIAERFMTDPVFVDLAQSQRQMAPQSVEHLCVRAPSNQHLEVLEAIIRNNNPERCIVFMKTKAFTDQVGRELRHKGIRAEALHSDLSQSRREMILKNFRIGRIRVLCATDVAARGLDIPECDLVVQVGPPANGLEYYIHRTGRTGRAGRKGQAVLIHSGSFEDRSLLKQISRMVNMKHVNAEEAYKVEPSSGVDDWSSGNTEKSWEQRVQEAVQQLEKVSDMDLQRTATEAKMLLEKSPDGGLHSVAAALYLLANKKPLPRPSFNHESFRPRFSNDHRQRRRQLFDDDD